MAKQKRIEDYGIKIGRLEKGKLNKITDVKGVKVGHCTIDTAENKTGVTVILPTENNIFSNKLIAASFVLNGFGKTLGLVQIDELGTLETPIALTNTLNVGLVHDAIVEYMIDKCEKEKIEIKSINPIICECNDSGLNNIHIRAVKKEHVFKAIEDSCEDFEEGDVGGGKGMTCYNLKGGIGSASRIIELDGKNYTLGVLVQSNHGLLEDFIINGEKIGQKISSRIKGRDKLEKGSIIMIVATDIPLSSRQLKRVCKRAIVGLIRTGSYIGNDSGEVIVGFSTANVIKKDEANEIQTIKIMNEDEMDKAFRAASEACEEAVLNSMVTAGRVIGYSGKIRESLQDYIDEL